MSEAIRTIMQYAPIVGATAGAATGVVAERVLHNRIAEERQPLNEIIQDVSAQTPTESRFSSLRRKAVLPLVGALALAGAGNGLAWQTEGETEQPSKIQLIVDRSGATDLSNGEGESTPATRINKIVEEFADHKETGTKILVGQGGDVIEKSPQQLIKDVRPFGNAPMQKAVNLSIESINSVSLNTEKDSNTTNSVVVLTNGNQFGKAKNVIDSTKESGISVFVKDVSDSTNGEKVQAMKKIATETGGLYLDNSAEPEEIYDAVKDEVQAKQPDQKSGSKHGIPEKAFMGLISLFGVGMVARARRKMPVTYNGSKIEK